MAALLALAPLAGCGPRFDSNCGNGMLDEGEACDDGIRFRIGIGQPDRPCEQCRPGRGYACDEDGFCEPVCNDGILAGELCDPSTPSGAGYCAPDCQSFIASCGDGVVQPEQEGCDSAHHACVDCEPGLLMTCTEGECIGSGLDPSLSFARATDAQRETFCAFYVAGLGGERARVLCGTVFVETGDAESCLEFLRNVPETCTVAAYERWIAERSSVCDLLLSVRRAEACVPLASAR